MKRQVRNSPPNPMRESPASEKKRKVNSNPNISDENISPQRFPTRKPNLQPINKPYQKTHYTHQYEESNTQHYQNAPRKASQQPQYQSTYTTDQAPPEYFSDIEPMVPLKAYKSLKTHLKHIQNEHEEKIISLNQHTTDQTEDLLNEIATLNETLYNLKQDRLKSLNLKQDIESQFSKAEGEYVKSVQSFQTRIATLKSQYKSLENEFLESRRMCEEKEYIIQDQDRIIHELRNVLKSKEDGLRDKDNIIGELKTRSGVMRASLGEVVGSCHDLAQIAQYAHENLIRGKDVTRKMLIQVKSVEDENEIIQNS